jgi:DNA-binding NtrC family response regulator
MEMVHFIPPHQRRVTILAAQADSAPVLIHGSSGTGKGAIARWLHSQSARAVKPFVVADHKTPLAHQIQAAQGGTLLINEIGEWPLGEQRMLLNFLITKAVPHRESPETRTLANVRIITTSSQSLESRAQGGLFNIELLEKLSVFRIEMPALKNRAEEFEDIVAGMIDEITREVHKEHVRTASPDSLDRLKGYDWPGNLRELRNVLRLAVLSAQGDRIESANLPDFGHDRIDFRATREQFEKIYLTELLKSFHWQIERTCKSARMDQTTLLQKMQKYGIPLQAPETRL